MNILNTYKKIIITKDLEEAKTFLDKSLGLLRRSSPRSLLFKTRFGIHTFGLKFNIDVLVLDKRLKVVKLRKSLKPNQFFFWNPRFNLIIELPEGSINQSKTRLGDYLFLRF